MTVKDHYDRYLGKFYSWTVGNFAEREHLQQQFFIQNGIVPHGSGIAFDLGSAQGVNSFALANQGFSVKAVEYNLHMQDELKARIGSRNIEVVDAHLLEYLYSVRVKPELIVCMDDTLTHLSGHDRVEELIVLSSQTLERGGKLIISYREFAQELINEKRFIQLNNDDTRLHTCYLEFLSGYVKVFDIVHEWDQGKWKQTVSWYPKLHIAISRILSLIEKYGLRLVKKEVIEGMTYLIAAK
jgi:hypothetical protein